MCGGEGVLYNNYDSGRGAQERRNPPLLLQLAMEYLNIHRVITLSN